MNEMDKSISELHTMLKTAEHNIKSKSSHVLMVQNGKGFKKKGKGKGKGKGKSNAQPKPKPEPKAKAPKEGVCFFCNEPGHWKRNCKLYLEDLKKKKKTGETSSSGIYVIQINFSPSSSWVLDTGCGSHICTNVQGLKRSNNITTKKFKSNDLNSTYLWHCRFGHINEKRISKLHKVGLLNSFDFESYDTCESCLLGKMTKDPFTGHNERANELLDLIHTDVCGPISSDARGGYKYFITFTDDCSRYGYVYLMRHKSESFEMFKPFQNEIQNQLGKTIKALRSDRGGEYLSQEFDDHSRTCGIISQLTPPGTPQWNGVS